MEGPYRPEIVGLAAEGTPDGALPEAISYFAPTRPEDVFAMLAYAGAPKGIEDMYAGIVAEARDASAGERP